MTRMLPVDQRFCRLTEVPVAQDADRQHDRLAATTAALLPTLVGAYAGGNPLVAAWVRGEAHGPLRVILGGEAAFGITDTSEVSPLYPPGSRGKRLTVEEVFASLRAFPSWLRCTGVVDALTATSPQEAKPEPTSTFDDYVAHLAGTPFAWLVTAEPIDPAVIGEQMRALQAQIPRLRDRRDVAEKDRIALERAEARYRELAQATRAGLWNVHVLVGGADEDAAFRVAALLCHSSSLSRLPYTLHPTSKIAAFDDIMPATLDDAELGASPFLGSSELLAALARPPVRELPGIRLVTAHTFDVMPEVVGEIPLGTVLDAGLQSAGPFQVSPGTLNRHTFVCGATGAGKSQTVRALLEELHRADIPWLVIEPAKAEYARMAGRLGAAGDVAVIRPGQADALPVSLNPLEPEPGFPLQTHIDLVRALFLAAFEAHEPFPQVLSRALTRCYEDLGWELALGESRYPGINPKYPSLGDLQRTAQDVVEHIGYGKELTGDVRGFIDIRIGSLRLGTPGRFFEGGHPLDVGDLLRRNVVFELEDIGNDQDKAFFIGTVLMRLVEHLRLRHQNDSGQPTRLRHVTVVEEAHRLLKASMEGTPAAHAVELFAGLLAEIRAYGEGMVIAEQIPSKIIPDVVKNTALKIVHRLPAHDDRFAVGATMNLDEPKSQYVVTLPPGQAAVFSDGMDRPLLVRMPLGEDREHVPDVQRSVGICRTRSAACGAACQQRACTLREMTEARRLAEDSRLVLWIELLTIAHIVGEPEPRPDPQWLDHLRGRAEPRLLDCALTHLAQATVDTRYAGLVIHYRPEDLAQHIATQARKRLDGNPELCDGGEIEWQGGGYRWIDVFRVFWSGDYPSGRPHPRTEEWRQRGLDLTGKTAEEQFAVLKLEPSSWHDPKTALHGYLEPPAYEQAASQLSHANDKPERLEEAMAFLNIQSPWSIQVLYPEAWRERQKDKEVD